VSFPGITQGHIASGNVIKMIYQYNLDKKYIVRFIDMNRFSQVQNTLQVKRMYEK
jgi:hypothetical protein